MNRTGILRYFAVLSAGVLIAAMRLSDRAIADQSQPGPPNPTVTDNPALLIRMNNGRYVPQTATIRIGQSVQFINDDEVGHTATASDGAFDSGYLGKGAVWRISFIRAGTVLFSDIYNPSMRGSIVVVVN